GELESVNYSDTTTDLAYTYDRRGRLTGVTDAVGTRTIAYSEPGQPLEEDFTSGVLDAVRIVNAYDTSLRRTENELLVSALSRNFVTFEYEEDSGRLEKVNRRPYRGAPDLALYSGQYAYKPHADLVDTLTFRHGTTLLTTGTRTYDNLDRLTTIAWDSAAGPDESYTYTYNDANQRTRLDLADGSYWIYTYDDLGQLLSGKRHLAGGAHLPGQQMEYAFD